MIKTILTLIVVLCSLNLVAMPNPHVVSCGDFIDESKRQYMFELALGENGQIQEFYFNVGWINNFDHVAIKVKQIKERTGLTTHKIIFSSLDGRFRIEKNKGLIKSDDHWTLNVNLPEANVSLKNFQASCMGYF